jgi:hypothetical protein
MRDETDREEADRDGLHVKTVRYTERERVCERERETEIWR